MNIEQKINRVVASCKTNKQILTASKYIVLAYKSKKIMFWEAKYWQGVINGIAHVKEWK